VSEQELGSAVTPETAACAGAERDSGAGVRNRSRCRRQPLCCAVSRHAHAGVPPTRVRALSIPKLVRAARALRALQSAAVSTLGHLSAIRSDQGRLMGTAAAAADEVTSTLDHGNEGVAGHS